MILRAREDEEDDDDDEYVMREATPRERQFGYSGFSRGRRSSGESVTLPINNLHAAAAQRQLAHILEASPIENPHEVIGAWMELLGACQVQAPALLNSWDAGVGALLRLAAAVPREDWLRSLSEPWAADVAADSSAEPKDGEPGEGGVADDAAAMPYLRALVKHLLCKYDVSTAAAGGFTWNDGAGGGLREGPGRAIVLCSPVGVQLSLRFVRFYAALGCGSSKPADAARELLTPAITKKMVHHFCTDAGAGGIPDPPKVELPEEVRHVQPLEVTLSGPLAALREAQVAALGGSPELGRAIAGSTRLGKDIGSMEEETFAASTLTWACQFNADLVDADAGQAVEWLLSQYATDPTFSVNVAGNPRSPKKVLAAAGQAAGFLELQRMQTSGQRFLRNPAGIKGFVKTGVMAAFGSPFDELAVVPQWLSDLGIRTAGSTEVPNSWHGDEYEYSEEEEAFIRDTKVMRRATVRIDEILSFEYLQHVGKQMRNCLRVEKRGGMSLVKYLSRVQARDSSFWVMTITPEIDDEELDADAGPAPVQEMLLVEVYNSMKVIHQAEGPHPRRWPRPDAWGWLQEWAAQEGLVPDGPEGVTVGPYGGYDGDFGRWDIRRCFLW